jgi:hypothetical protein
VRETTKKAWYRFYTDLKEIRVNVKNWVNVVKDCHCVKEKANDVAQK